MELLLWAVLKSFMTINNKKDILFIVNPISGVGKQKLVEKEVAAHLDKNKFTYQFIYAERAHHAYDIAKDAAIAGVDIVAIVGGDGSVNETAKALVNTSTRMAIIPTGSGNGLARQIGIPCNVRQAILHLNKSKDLLIDTGFIGEHFFVGAAGFGFDALIAHEFPRMKKRGFASYIKLFFKNILKYTPQSFEVEGLNSVDSKDCFVFTISNSGQYGNGAVICPQSVLNDGELELVIIKKIPVLLLPFFAIKLFAKTLKNGNYYSSQTFKKISIKGKNVIAHVDGEPIVLPNEFEVKVVNKSLLVLS
ncbi:MAG: diacylglycerol/lipid kinase family protein [Flavobacteriales bacterium]